MTYTFNWVSKMSYLPIHFDVICHWLVLIRVLLCLRQHVFSFFCCCPNRSTILRKTSGSLQLHCVSHGPVCQQQRLRVESLLWGDMMGIGHCLQWRCMILRPNAGPISQVKTSIIVFPIQSTGMVAAADLLM